MKRLTTSLRLLAALLISCLPLVINAQTLPTEPAWIRDVKVSSIIVQPNGSIYIVLDQTDVVPNLGCHLSDGQSLELSPFSTYFDEQYALIIAAQASQQNVRIYASGCGNLFPLAQNTRLGG